MDLSSPGMKEIADAIAVLHGGETDRGRSLLLQLWETTSAGTALQRSALAHFLADTETDVADALEWDLRALEAATGSREAEDRDPAPPVPESFLASLHLSVAEGCRRLGDLERARRHAACASNRVGILADDSYGQLIRGGLRRLQARLATPG
jgi:hypothetical protein